MSEPSVPISPEDFVLRRVHRNLCRPDPARPIQRVAFQPNKNDVTGISVYLERDHSENPAGILEGIADADRRAEYYVVKISVRELQNLGLSVIAEEADIPGHCVIPELAVEKYRGDRAEKKRLDLILAQLADLANAAILVRPREE